ncbi:unnamed protein product [Lupinus luteus]|uniref:Uncharacterized protein n=1 Tax=Lupinus luteus TaxID=3873 RepID=A0AAV1WFL8_LUPLU
MRDEVYGPTSKTIKKERFKIRDKLSSIFSPGITTGEHAWAPSSLVSPNNAQTWTHEGSGDSEDLTIGASSKDGSPSVCTNEFENFKFNNSKGSSLSGRKIKDGGPMSEKESKKVQHKNLTNYLDKILRAVEYRTRGSINDINEELRPTSKTIKKERFKIRDKLSSIFSPGITTGEHAWAPSSLVSPNNAQTWTHEGSGDSEDLTIGASSKDGSPSVCTNEFENFKFNNSKGSSLSGRKIKDGGPMSEKESKKVQHKNLTNYLDKILRAVEYRTRGPTSKTIKKERFKIRDKLSSIFSPGITTGEHAWAPSSLVSPNNAQTWTHEGSGDSEDLTIGASSKDGSPSVCTNEFENFKFNNSKGSSLSGRKIKDGGPMSEKESKKVQHKNLTNYLDKILRAVEYRTRGSINDINEELSDPYSIVNVICDVKKLSGMEPGSKLLAESSHILRDIE